MVKPLLRFWHLPDGAVDVLQSEDDQEDAIHPADGCGLAIIGGDDGNNETGNKRRWQTPIRVHPPIKP